MSKRPQPGPGARPGRRSLVGYLRDTRIGIKLGFIMFVPTLATVIVGANGLVTQISTANSADRARTLSTLSEFSGTLVDDLQAERADSIMWLGSPPKSANAVTASKAYAAEAQKSVTAAAAYTRESTSLANLPDNFNALLTRIQKQIGDLPALRTQVSANQIPMTIASQRLHRSHQVAARTSRRLRTTRRRLHAELRDAGGVGDRER